MTYQHERGEFISLATAEGLSLETCRKLLRYATTLQRLAEAQCNGDYPYNGDRDRPAIADGLGAYTGNGMRDCAKWDACYTTCPKCEASGVAKSAMRLSSEWWQMNGGITAHKPADLERKRARVCPDCRTQELVRALLTQFAWEDCESCGGDHPQGFTGDCREDKYRRMDAEVKPIFNGDPRGAVLRLATPNYPWTEDGRGRGLYVPARVR